MCFLAMVQPLKMELAVADCKHAFCQSSALHRPAGRVFVASCSGVPLPKNGLIELVASVYELNGAPFLVHRTLTKHMVEIGFRKSLLDPCLYVRSDIVLIEVDDSAIGTYRDSKLREELTSKFVFGKWNDENSDYAGGDRGRVPIRSSWTTRNMS